MRDDSSVGPAIIVDDCIGHREDLAEELKCLRPDKPIVEVDSLPAIQEYLCSGRGAGVVFLDLNLHGIDPDHVDEVIMNGFVKRWHEQSYIENTTSRKWSSKTS